MNTKIKHLDYTIKIKYILYDGEGGRLVIVGIISNKQSNTTSNLILFLNNNVNKIFANF
jgi:hypothetical protein